MAAYEELKPVKTFMGKLEHDKDLLGELTKICLDNNIKLGKVEVLGAVKKTRIGYYDQDNKQYSFIEMNEHLEITGLVGNVSLKNGKPIVHAHITLADKDGNAFGGHLAEGTIVFACEFYLTSLDGPEYERGYDKTTGLPLWQM
ncbi:MAG: DNA-binding protein [Sedimentisphaerales bacterium]|nr:DNA-binding protein [Sedimentisphaerales bacterium]